MATRKERVVPRKWIVAAKWDLWKLRSRGPRTPAAPSAYTWLVCRRLVELPVALASSPYPAFEEVWPDWERQVALGPGIALFGSFVRRQLFLPIDDNYFPRSTTITFGLLGGAKRPPPGGGPSPPAAGFLFLRSIYIRGGGKVGNLLLVFHFSIRPRRRSCGNVGIAPPFGEISKGLVESGGSLLLAFPSFHSPGISTAHTPSGFAPWHHAGSPPSSSAWFSACCFCLACSTR